MSRTVAAPVGVDCSGTVLASRDCSFSIDGASLGPEAEEIAVTAGQRLIQQGRQEGRQEGQARMLLKLLSLRFGELSPEITARVQAANEQTLERLSERVITASTLSGVFDDS